MVRNVVVAHLKEGTTDSAVDEVVRTLKALKTPGLLSMTLGRDLGLRDGNASLAIVSDLADEAAYQSLRRGRGAQPDPAGIGGANCHQRRALPVPGELAGMAIVAIGSMV